PASDHHLLLVAAGEIAGNALDRGRLDVEPADELLRGDLLLPELQYAELRPARDVRQRQVLPHREIDDEPLIAAVLGDEGEALPFRRPGIGGRRTPAGDGHRTALARQRADEGECELRSPGSDETRDTE